MTSRSASPLSPPSWGGSLRPPIGGFALAAFCALLWATFLAAISPPAPAPRETTPPAYARAAGR